MAGKGGVTTLLHDELSTRGIRGGNGHYRGIWEEKCMRKLKQGFGYLDCRLCMIYTINVDISESTNLCGSDP